MSSRRRGRRTSAPLFGVALVAAVLLGGCGDGSGGEVEPVVGVPLDPVAAGDPADGSEVATAPMRDEAAPTESPDDVQAKRMLEIARTGAPGKRPQAAARLATLGEAAARALRDVVGATNDDLGTLGPELLPAIAGVGDAELRARVWSAVHDSDFPYRPAATTALARTATADELGAFEALLEDPLSYTRSAAVEAFAVVDDRAKEDVVRGLLRDPSDIVRRAAADLLATWGEAWALRWLVEDLGRTDRFFELETGRNARYESARVLRGHLDRELFGYKAGDEPTTAENVAAIAAVREAVEARAGADAPRPPDFALVSDEVVDGVLGLEIRSCRRGEYFLAVTDDDRLLVGTGHPRSFALRPGAAERLVALAAKEFAEPDTTPLYGEFGCDQECYRLGAGDGERFVVRVMKGPQGPKDLRPERLDATAGALLAEIPEDLRLEGDDRGFVEELRDALRAVGGAL
ncbi:MAG: HEAT repeat domain-containing protein [Planctomycetota bacterium]